MVALQSPGVSANRSGAAAMARYGPPREPRIRQRLGERLKERVFLSIFPHLAQGFLEDRKHRLGVKGEPTEDELDVIFEATLTLLYRLLFLLCTPRAGTCFRFVRLRIRRQLQKDQRRESQTRQG